MGDTNVLDNARNKARFQNELRAKIMTEIATEIRALALEQAAEEVGSPYYRDWLQARAQAVRQDRRHQMHTDT